MIFEHEIPSGSRLYFGEGARLKRRLESEAARILESEGFREIVTPLFSYHQQEQFDDPKTLIRLNDSDNHEVSLRADSTADVVRIVTRRLGRSQEGRRWFYIQPVYAFPTSEQYQIGVEALEGEFSEICRLGRTLLETLQLQPVLQIANIAIPEILGRRYGVDLESLRAMRLEEILASEHPWMRRLAKLHRIEDLEDLEGYPEEIAEQLRRLEEAARRIDYPRIVVSPLYYARLRYYDALFFRFFEGNRLYMTGGTYRIDEVRAAGFALYTDACIAKKMEKGTDV